MNSLACILLRYLGIFSFFFASAMASWSEAGTCRIFPYDYNTTGGAGNSFTNDLGSKGYSVMTFECPVTIDPNGNFYGYIASAWGPAAQIMGFSCYGYIATGDGQITVVRNDGVCQFTAYLTASPSGGFSGDNVFTFGSCVDGGSMPITLAPSLGFRVPADLILPLITTAHISASGESAGSAGPYVVLTLDEDTFTPATQTSPSTTSSATEPSSQPSADDGFLDNVQSYMNGSVQDRTTSKVFQLFQMDFSDANFTSTASGAEDALDGFSDDWASRHGDSSLPTPPSGPYTINTGAGTDFMHAYGFDSTANVFRAMISNTETFRGYFPEFFFYFQVMGTMFTFGISFYALWRIWSWAIFGRSYSLPGDPDSME